MCFLSFYIRKENGVSCCSTVQFHPSLSVHKAEEKKQNKKKQQLSRIGFYNADRIEGKKKQK